MVLWRGSDCRPPRGAIVCKPGRTPYIFTENTMNAQRYIHGAPTDPIEELVARDGEAALAIIAGVTGPSYRPVGAMMAVLGEKDRVGSLSSGCIEADIEMHALDALRKGVVTKLRYGIGSPFADIELPCGGGLDIAIVPRPDRSVLEMALKERVARKPFAIDVNLETGALTLCPTDEGTPSASTLRIRENPQIRFLIFGKGPEASTFAGLVRSGGYPHTLFSPDPETIEICTRAGCDTKHILDPKIPHSTHVDPRTAIVLFFHDHDWEPPILQSALQTPAFYIGAQGSQRARDTRHAVLASLGIASQETDRLRGPIGLIPSARDPGTLAVSVLAEVLSVAKADEP